MNYCNETKGCDHVQFIISTSVTILLSNSHNLCVVITIFSIEIGKWNAFLQVFVSEMTSSEDSDKNSNAEPVLIVKLPQSY